MLTRNMNQNERIKILSQWIVEDTEILVASESNDLDDGSDLEASLEDDNFDIPLTEGTSLKNVDINYHRFCFNHLLLKH